MATTRTMYIGHADQALVKIELGFFQLILQYEEREGGDKRMYKPHSNGSLHE